MTFPNAATPSSSGSSAFWPWLIRRREEVAATLFVIAAWTLPISLAVSGIQWQQGGGHAVREAPPAWNEAQQWAVATVWVGGAVLATAVTLTLIVGAARRKLSAAILAAKILILIELVWTITAFVLIGVIYNGLVMA